MFTRPVNSARHQTFVRQLINEIAKFPAWVQRHRSKLSGVAATYENNLPGINSFCVRHNFLYIRKIRCKFSPRNHSNFHSQNFSCNADPFLLAIAILTQASMFRSSPVKDPG